MVFISGWAICKVGKDGKTDLPEIQDALTIVPTLYSLYMQLWLALSHTCLDKEGLQGARQKVGRRLDGGEAGQPANVELMCMAQAEAAAVWAGSAHVDHGSTNHHLPVVLVQVEAAAWEREKGKAQNSVMG